MCILRQELAMQPDTSYFEDLWRQLDRISAELIARRNKAHERDDRPTAIALDAAERAIAVGRLRAWHLWSGQPWANASRW